jgi:hypothetical protein
VYEAARSGGGEEDLALLLQFKDDQMLASARATHRVALGGGAAS